MNRVAKEFVSDEVRQYKIQVGHALASGLAGFVAGVVFATIVWGFVIYFLELSV